MHYHAADKQNALNNTSAEFNSSSHNSISNNNNKANANQTHKDNLSSSISANSGNSEDNKNKKNSRRSSNASSKRNSQQDSKNNEFVNMTMESSTATQKAEPSATATAIIASNTSNLTLDQIQAFHSMRDEEINRMVERYKAHVQAEAAQNAAEQRAREMTLHLNNDGTIKIVEDVYGSMEDELSLRQGKILQRISALEDILGISSNAAVTTASRNGSGNSADARNSRSANKNTRNAMQTKNKKSSSHPSSSSMKRE